MTKKAIRKWRRSGTRPCDVCGQVRLLVEHHIGGRNIRNAEAAWNRAAICATCHDEVHATPPRKIIKEWAMTTKGRKLLWEASI